MSTVAANGLRLNLYEAWEYYGFRFEWLYNWKNSNDEAIITANKITIARTLLLIPAMYAIWTGQEIPFIGLIFGGGMILLMITAKTIKALGKLVVIMILLTCSTLLTEVPGFTNILCSYWGDHLDGLYARTANQTSALGAYLDRTLDKIGNIAVKTFYIWVLPFQFYAVAHLKWVVIASITVESIALTVSLWQWYWDHANGYPDGDKNKASRTGKRKMLIDSICIISSTVIAYYSLGNEYVVYVLTGAYTYVTFLACKSMWGHITGK